MVTLFPALTVTFPTAVVAKDKLELSVKNALLPDVHPVPPVGLAGFDQLAPVHDWPAVPSVLQ